MAHPWPSQISLCHSCDNDNAFTQSTLLPSATQSAALLAVLRTNCGHSQTAAMRAVIAAAPAELARYSEELARLDTISEPIVAGRKALQKLYDECVCVVRAPVRQLPNEILVEIFSFCRDADTSPTVTLEPVALHHWEHAATAELRRVAGGALVSLAQVCAKWHRVVLGTPQLWSCITLDLRCWTLPVETMRAGARHGQMIQLLKAALARGQQTPLTMQVSGVGEFHPHALEVLALSARRWRHVSLAMDCAMLKNLSPVAGNLPLLETFMIQPLSEDEEVLADVISGPLAVAASLPLAQLQRCGYDGVCPEDLPALLSAMAQLPPASEFRAQLHLEAIRAVLPLDLPAIESQIGALDIELMKDQNDDSYHALGALFEAITLLQMQRLTIFGMPQVGLHNQLCWPHPAAQALFARSGSRRTLRTLCIPDVVITEAELLECLAELPALEYLFISDHPSLAAASNVPHLLITDSLLEALTPSLANPADCLLPRLKIVEFRTLGRFSDSALLDFVGGRLTLRDKAGFECAVLWFPGHPRKPDVLTTNYLETWTVEEGLLFICREFDPNEDQ
ncbi:hypothetical protein B0H17DRAFT_1146464 [Mycena rosella]|uniref:F-box domain-containing protein n=1 Tax=Mycena rosella TaxID=1033263 RepID=A0AAD7CNV8_MYCRO|nr:hypothetical protein B0H17DRAFT_1146464 [Mycena rosella]